MQTKAFLFGALSGAAAVAAALFLLRGEWLARPSATPGSQPSQTLDVESGSAAAPSVTPVSPERADLPAGVDRDKPVAADATVSSPQEGTARATSLARTPDQNAGLASQTSLQQQAPGLSENASVPSPETPHAEPNDPAWSYQMEQALQQTLAAQPDARKFDISSIECRDTYCELRAYAFDESALPEWQRIVHDIRQQPWSDFGQTGTSAGIVSGRWQVRATLHRRGRTPD